MMTPATSRAPRLHSITVHSAMERSRTTGPAPNSLHAASLTAPGPNRRERNFLIRSAIILLAVDGNILSRPAAIWSHVSANLNLSMVRKSCSPASLHSGDWCRTSHNASMIVARTKPALPSAVCVMRWSAVFSRCHFVVTRRLRPSRATSRRSPGPAIYANLHWAGRSKATISALGARLM
jgi:hypothetical protein